MSEAYGAARELLDRAEEDAARIRFEADRYRRQREQEAELLVAKARRVLAIAEQRAASIGQTPRDTEVIDLADVEAPAPHAADAPDEAEAEGPTGLDGMLKSAIARAFDQSFHLGS